MDKILEIIDEIGLPFAYDHFAEGESPDPSFLIYFTPKSNNFGADNKVYQKINEYSLEVYTDKKDTAQENRVESILDAHEIFYEKSEVWVSSESLYLVLYQFDII